jgi:hypothetical protein
MSTILCYVTLSCAVSTIANASLNDFFSALTGWILASVTWLLDTVVAVLNATGDPSTIVAGATPEFATLLSLSPALVVLGLLVATLQAVRHGDHAALWRVYLGVMPASVAAIFLAKPLALLVLEAIDAMSTAASAATAAHLATLATALNNVTVIPGFGVFLLSGLVIAAGVILWIELLFRTVALTLLLVFVPLIVPLSTFPALRRVAWRLAETFLVIAGSKIIVVITLAVGLGEVVSSDATSILSGVVTLLLACATPFVVLRLVPIMEQSSAHAFDGLRQRAVRAAMASPQSPIGLAVQRLLPAAPLPEPPTKGDDLGFPTWEGGGDLPLPPRDGERPAPPIGEPRLRRGKVAYYKDKMGPVVGWHWDD